MKEFRGRHAVITGGSSGIGLATAKLLAGRGASVTIVARDRERLEAACEVIAAASPMSEPPVRYVVADVAVAEEAERAVGEAMRGGEVPIDLLVNAAGVILPGYFESMPLSYFDDCMDSWKGCVYMSRAAVPGMIGRGSGHIVNVSSVAGFMGAYGYTAYSSAKYAVIGLSEALRNEMKPYGISVSVICPPDTDTPGLALEKSLRPPETEKVVGNIAAVAPDVVARALVRGVEKDKFLVIPGAVSKVYRFAKENARWLFFAIVDSDVRKVREQRGE